MTPSNRRVREPEQLSLPQEAPPVEPPTSRWLSVLRSIVGIGLVVSAALGVATVARRYVLTTPRFSVTDLSVVGNDRRSPDLVVSESGVSVGTNIFSVDLDAARAKILTDPWIADAQLARRLPGTVLVQVTERKAAALVALGDTYLVTSDGEPFKKLELGDPTDLPFVTGLRPESLSDDREGTMRTIRRALDLAAEYDHVAFAHRSALEEVHIQTDGTFAVVVGHGALQLVLGQPPFRRKLDQAARVMAELDKRGAKADAIMLDNDARPDRVVVRMR